MKKFVVAIAVFIATAIPAFAQDPVCPSSDLTCPAFTFGFVPTPAQWQNWWNSKQAALNFTPAPSTAPVTNSLSGDVALNNTSNYFTGPTVAQGSIGTWCAAGTVTILTAASDTIDAKLWDGTTVIASAAKVVATTTSDIALSGCLASPAGNLRISIKDATNTTANIKFNSSGNSKDSTLTAWRVQ